MNKEVEVGGEVVGGETREIGRHARDHRARLATGVGAADVVVRAGARAKNNTNNKQQQTTKTARTAGTKDA